MGSGVAGERGGNELGVAAVNLIKSTQLSSCSASPFVHINSGRNNALTVVSMALLASNCSCFS